MMETIKKKFVSLEHIKLPIVVSNVLSDRRIALIIFIFTVIFLSWLSYGKVFDYDFWRDDTKVVWMQRYVPSQINNFHSGSVARGRIGAIVFDYFIYTILGL